MDRYVRQTKLAEVGVSGQTRIARSLVDVCLDGAAADVAARYLGGAGVAGVRVRDAAIACGARAIAPALRVDVDPTLAIDFEGETFDLRDPACRDLARGACAALRALRAALALDAPAPGVPS
ncbi:MAG TPA: hypothetical protein VN894_12470 [Polyangiaceae bacterium]|nr:hypothetical protein [Polyangiaceae bacterium]